MSRWRIPGSLLGASVVLATVVVVSACEQGDSWPSSPTRPSPGRLWHEDGYRRFVLPASGPAEIAAPAPATRGAIADRSRAVEGWLERGRATKALNALEAEVLEGGLNLRLGTDLSAAHLTRAAQALARDDSLAGLAALDLIEAARWARRASELDPAAPQPRFNYATALARLSLVRASEREWRRYLELDPRSGWAGEGRRTVRSFAEQERSRDWARTLPTLAATADPEAIRALVVDFGYASRVHVEKAVLPGWPEDAGEPGGELHTLGRRIAAELAARRGEQLLADEIAFLDEARGEARRRLIEAHRGYAEGLEAYEEKRYADARERWRTAYRSLEELGAPFRFAAAVQYAIALNVGDPSAARTLLRELDRTVPDRYPTVRGRVHWMLGSAGVAREEWPVVLDHFELAARELEKGAGRWRAAGAHALLGEALDRYGDSDAAWRHYLEALQATAGHPDRSRRHGTLFGMVDTLVRSGRAEQALPFCDELVLNAEAWGDEGAVAEAYTRRAWAWMELGREAASRGDVAVAVEAAGKIAPTRLAYRSARFVEVLVETRFGGWADLEALEAAHRRYSRDELAYERLPFLLARARLQEADGDLEGSFASLTEAMELHEARGGDFHPTGTRLLARSLAEDVYRRLVRQAVALGRPAEALLLADRSRWLGRRASEVPGAHRAEDPEEFLAAVSAPFDAGTVLLDFTVLDHESVALVVEVGSGSGAPTVRAVPIPAGRKAVNRQVERLSRALEGSEPRSRRIAAEAYQLLIAPLGLGDDLRRLIVVPDRSLWRLPFGALVDPGSDRHLVERATVSLALSLRQAAGAAPRRGRLDRSAPPPALVVGATDLAGTRWRRRPPLPGAELEVEAVSALYPDAVVLADRGVGTEELLASLAGRSLFHFAGHADVDAERREGARLLLSRPGSDSLSSWELIDGDWSGLELAFLSACRTLDGYEVGREGLVGFGSTFVAGGALAAVVSRWDVDDVAAGRFAVRFHKAYLETRDPAEALRAVALHDLEAGEPGLFWAAFAVLGA